MEELATCRREDFNGKAYYNGTLKQVSDDVQQPIPQFQHQQLAYIALKREQPEQKVADPQDAEPAVPALEAEEPQIEDAPDAGPAAPVLEADTDKEANADDGRATPPQPLPRGRVESLEATAADALSSDSDERMKSPPPPPQVDRALQAHVSVPPAAEPTPVVSVAPAVDVRVKLEEVDLACLPWRLDFSTCDQLIDNPSDDETLDERERLDDNPIGFLAKEATLRDEYGRRAVSHMLQMPEPTRLFEMVSGGRVGFGEFFLLNGAGRSQDPAAAEHPQEEEAGAHAAQAAREEEGQWR